MQAGKVCALVVMWSHAFLHGGPLMFFLPGLCWLSLSIPYFVLLLKLTLWARPKQNKCVVALKPVFGVYNKNADSFSHKQINLIFLRLEILRVCRETETTQLFCFGLKLNALKFPILIYYYLKIIHPFVSQVFDSQYDCELDKNLIWK